jgi:threonine dehydrogenase-like Zn-dependent dehydrogenase
VSEREEQAEALWYVAPRRAEIGVETVAAPRPDEVMVRAVYGGISRGTERLVYSGRVPASEYQRMRAPMMAGAFPFPVKYGYATVGVVAAGPDPLLGRTVFALHPHQTRFIVPADAVMAVPDAVPARRAVLAANMETALNAVWDAGASPCDRIAVVGAGVVGALTAWLCARLPGTAVTLVDIDPGRAALAAALGVGFALAENAPADCDVVIHASGSGAGLATALALAGDEASVVEMSWYGATEVTVALGGAFHSRRLKLISSQVGRVSPGHQPRWTFRRRLASALDLLADDRLDALLAPAIAFHDLPGRLGDIFSPAGGVLCQVIDYG